MSDTTGSTKTVLESIKLLTSRNFELVPFIKVVIWHFSQPAYSLEEWRLISHTDMYKEANEISWTKYWKPKATN